MDFDKSMYILLSYNIENYILDNKNRLLMRGD